MEVLDMDHKIEYINVNVLAKILADHYGYDRCYIEAIMTLPFGKPQRIQAGGMLSLEVDLYNSQVLDIEVIQQPQPPGETETCQAICGKKSCL